MYLICNPQNARVLSVGHEFESLVIKVVRIAQKNNISKGEREIVNDDKIRKSMEKGLALLKGGYAVEAVFCFEEIVIFHGRLPGALSWMGLALARAEGDLKSSESLCIEAIQNNVFKADYYKNLAEVYLLMQDKSKAVQILRNGLSLDKHSRQLKEALKKLGIRGKKTVPFLSRSNPVNKYIGLAKFKTNMRVHH